MQLPSTLFWQNAPVLNFITAPHGHFSENFGITFYKIFKVQYSFFVFGIFTLTFSIRNDKIDFINAGNCFVCKTGWNFSRCTACLFLLPSLELFIYYHIRICLSTILLNFFQLFLLTCAVTLYPMTFRILLASSMVKLRLPNILENACLVIPIWSAIQLFL